MATKTVTVCDMCTEDELRSVITVHFEVDGVQYEVDLCEQHKADWDSLERARRQFAQVARAQTEVLQPTRAPSSRRGNDSPERREENRELRVWAQQEGIALPRAGRQSREQHTPCRNGGESVLATPICRRQPEQRTGYITRSGRWR
jgi:hypothetical protein